MLSITQSLYPGAMAGPHAGIMDENRGEFLRQAIRLVLTTQPEA